VPPRYPRGTQYPEDGAEAEAGDAIERADVLGEFHAPYLLGDRFAAASTSEDEPGR